MNWDKTYTVTCNANVHSIRLVSIIATVFCIRVKETVKLFECTLFWVTFDKIIKYSDMKAQLLWGKPRLTDERMSALRIESAGRNVFHSLNTFSCQVSSISFRLAANLINQDNGTSNNLLNFYEPGPCIFLRSANFYEPGRWNFLQLG